MRCGGGGKVSFEGGWGERIEDLCWSGREEQEMSDEDEVTNHSTSQEESSLSLTGFVNGGITNFVKN